MLPNQSCVHLIVSYIFEYASENNYANAKNK